MQVSLLFDSQGVPFPSTSFCAVCASTHAHAAVVGRLDVWLCAAGCQQCPSAHPKLGRNACRAQPLRLNVVEKRKLCSMEQFFAVLDVQSLLQVFTGCSACSPASACISARWHLCILLLPGRPIRRQSRTRKQESPMNGTGVGFRK